MNYLKLLRTKHYIKNALLFLPIFFAKEIQFQSNLKLTIIGFIVFSLSASIIYIINDIKDLDKDRQHPIKRNRPIASGEITKAHAYTILFILVILVFLLHILFNLSISSIYFLVFYIISNILYTFIFKNFPLLDISFIALSYILRIYYGAAITNILISNWLILTIIAFSYFMALGKRRNELIKNGTDSRSVLTEYNHDFLDKSMYVSETLFIVFYSLWCLSGNNLSTHSNLLVWSVPLIIMITFRYTMILENDSFGDPADVLFSDRMLIFFVLVFCVFLWILYLL